MSGCVLLARRCLEVFIGANIPRACSSLRQEDVQVPRSGGRRRISEVVEYRDCEAMADIAKARKAGSAIRRRPFACADWHIWHSWAVATFSRMGGRNPLLPDLWDD